MHNSVTIQSNTQLVSIETSIPTVESITLLIIYIFF